MPISIGEKIAKLLGSEKYLTDRRNYDRRELIKFADSLNLAPMKLIHSDLLRNLKRIPNYVENKSVNAIEGINQFDPNIVEVFFVSHRWLRPSIDFTNSYPDNLDHTKAMVLNEYTKWRKSWIKSRYAFDPEIFYWIDYSCIDPKNKDISIPLLPIWVACCERMLRIETADYLNRAWCRLEILMSYVYAFTDHQDIITLDFRNPWPQIGREIHTLIQNPSEGSLTLKNDLDAINSLVKQSLLSSTKEIEFNKSILKSFRF